MSLLILLEAVNLPNISNREQQASTMYHAEQNLRLVSGVKRLGLLIGLSTAQSRLCLRSKTARGY